MANKFDTISADKTSGFSNLNLLNETFHIFSKSPASPTTPLANASLKSGHTTTASDVWSNEIPAFFKADSSGNFTAFAKLAETGDLCLYGGKVYEFKNGTFTLINAGTQNEGTLTDGQTFSKNGKEVIKYHKGRTAINLTADNNSGDGSNNYSARIYNAATGSTTFVSQFISGTDKIVDGVPSAGYNATVVVSSVPLSEDLEADEGYICNAYAGVIQFNKVRTQGSVTVSAWEYIGEKLTETLSSITGESGAIQEAIADATLASGTKIADTTTENEGKLVTASHVKTYVSENAKVSVSADNSTAAPAEAVTSIKVAGDKTGADVTIATAKDTVGTDGAATITVSAALKKATVTANTDGSVTISDADKVKVVTAAGAQAIAAAAVNALDANNIGSGAVKVTQANGKVTTVTTTTTAITSTTGGTTTLIDAVSSDTALVTAKEALKAIGVAKKYTDDGIAAISGTNGSLTNHINNTTAHITADERTKWNTAATNAGSAVQSVGNISGAYITATATEDATTHAVTWKVNDDALTTALGKKADADKIVTYTGTAPISVPTSGTTRAISIATANGTATGAVKLSDATNGTSGVSGGIAATPKAVSDALTAAKNAIKIDSVIVGGTALTPANKAVTIPTATVGGTGVGLVTLGSLDEIDGNAGATSSKAATEAAVAKAIASLESTIETIMGTGVNYAVAATLPTASKDLLGWIYLIKDTTSATAGDYIEHICVNSGTTAAPVYTWEQIGSTKADHTAYASSITLGTNNSVTVSNNIANLAGKVVTGVKTANGVSGTVEASTGIVTLTVQDATSAQKGIVTLSSQGAIAAATGSTDTKAATVGAVAATIAGLDATSSIDSAGLKVSQTNGKVSASLTTATVATDGTITNGGYLTTANDAQKLVSAAIGALDVAETSSNGITWSQTDGTVSISISADETPTYGSNKFVTSKGIQSAIAAAKAAATTKVEKASTTVTDDVTSTTNTNGSTTYTIDTLSDVTITREDTGSASKVVGNKLIFNNGSNKYVDWSRVTVAEGAFQNSNIEAFHADLENLTNGKNMFNGSRGLKSFCGNLSSLTDGTDMFAGCALDLESLIYILDSLPDNSGSETKPSITIGVGFDEEGVDEDLASEDDITAFVAELKAKGWNSSVIWNGSVINGTDTTE